MIVKFRDLQEGDIIKIEGRKYKIIKTQIGNTQKGFKRINLKLVKK
jgi:translation elongation factor P/translation initiation factor 5A